jgi:thiosulfate/3-mercaptopyruvate sulfurtransferase
MSLKTSFRSVHLGVLMAFLAAVVSCQTPPPTKTANQAQIEPEISTSDALHDFLKSKPVILDARSPLDFSVSHAPGAISVQWQDFAHSEAGFRGILLDDEFSLARRLSLWGIDPETPVLVLGNGPNGKGEEGRVAWMLKYLGVKNVRISSSKAIRSTIPRPEGSPENKAVWKPVVNSEYLVSTQDFKKYVFARRIPISKARIMALGLGAGNSGALDPEIVVLDVTGTDLGNPWLVSAGVPVKKIFWKKFIDDKGQIRPEVVEDLKAQHLSTNNEIFVLSENGESSGEVTFILRELGYQAKNFAGGIEFLQRAEP